ncbi:MAG: hypothetical protein NTW87_24850 [Planctomycetota bacterium]|nr:hypothetical protein [Planctomycetota bacterium]
MDTALRWLASHQEADGHWDAQKCSTADSSDTVATSFALLAFLGAGHTEKLGEHKTSVQKAVAWLKSKQAANGAITDETDANNKNVTIPPTAIAALALAEATGMGNVTDTRTAAQAALDYCVNVHPGAEPGWGFKAKDPGDLTASIWFIMALKSARVAGLKVAPSAFDNAIKFLDSIEHKLGKETDTGHGPASIYWRTKTAEDAHANHPSAHLLTAMGTLARQFLGWKKEDLQANVEWFVAKGGVPAWEKAEPLYWYFGTLCVFQQGGDLWKTWNEALKTMLVDNQSKTGDASGSWNTQWGAMTGSLCLEAYYRYQQVAP